MEENRVLVTGGAGFHGSWVVEELMQWNKDIVVFDNFSAGKRSNLEHLGGSGRLTIVEGDIRDKASLEKVFDNVDYVYHLAAEPLTVGLEDPFLMESVNSAGTLNVLHAAYQHKVKRFNYISSCEVYGSAQRIPMDESHPFEPRTIYSASKLAGEAYTLGFHNCYGMDYTIIRPFNAYGPRHRTDGYSAVIFRFLERFLKGLPPIIYGDGNQTRDFNFVKDNARGIVLAGESDKTLNTVINIGSGKETSINDLARIMAKALGKDLAAVYDDPRPGDIRRHCAGAAKAKKLLGYNPEYSLEEGLKETIAWYTHKHH